MNGIIIIDKPEGWTSHDVVAKLRGALGIKRVGHGGTLDPMATGVLPVFVGRATRAVEFCANADKEYIAGLRPGVVTDTQDITGNILSSCEAGISPQELSEVIPRFLYAQKQIPPMYSAVKIGGKRLYELARRGVEAERPARDIFVSELELLPDDGGAGGSQFTTHSSQLSSSKNPSYPCGLSQRSPIGLGRDCGSESAATGHRASGFAEGDFLLRVVCSKGTYIRTLCHDIGAALGCGAVMCSLRRVRAGLFSLGMAHTLDSVLEAAASGEADRVLLPVDTVFSGFEAITLDDAGTRKLMNGAGCRVAGGLEDGLYRVYGVDGGFLALGKAAGGEVKAVKSF